GPYSIRPNHEVGFDPAAVRKICGDGVAGIFKSLQSLPPVIALRWKGIAQNPVYAFPRRHHLWAVALKRHAPAGVKHPPFIDLHAQVAGDESQILQGGDQRGLRNDAGAASRQFALDALEDIDVPSDAAQQNSGKQAAHRAADNERSPTMRNM